jgi:FMN-dependent NADH-azoreductase
MKTLLYIRSSVYAEGLALGDASRQRAIARAQAEVDRLAQPAECCA